MLHKVKARGSDDNRFLQIETERGNRWVEVNPKDGTILRTIKPRRFITYNENGDIIAVHDIEFSEHLEKGEAISDAPTIEITNEAQKKLSGEELIKKYKVKSKKLVEA
jgi:hypothetical protein